jgi:hypothetical protein
MKTLNYLLAVAVLMASAAITPAANNVSHALAFGLRQHTETDRTDRESFAFEDDLAYGLSYQCREGISYWQIGMMYLPDPSGADDVDYVLTPEMNLVMAENYWRLGVGILKDYVKTESSGSDWGDIYWQVMAGIGFPIGGMRLEVMALYAFDSWSKIDEFDTDDLEYGAWLAYVF